MKICNFCNHNTEQEVEAHAIPKAIFMDVKYGKEPLYEMGITGHAKKRPIGVWDKSIWCFNCEKKYETIDTKGIEIIRYLQSERKSNSLTKDIHLAGGSTSDLHDFALFVLWRASAASISFYSSVKLGPIEGKLRSALFSGNQSIKSEFTMFVLSVNNPPDTILQPVRIKIQGVNFIKLYFNRINILLKVDSRKAPKIISETQVVRDRPSFILPFQDQSAEISNILGLIAKNRSRKRS